MTAYVLLNPSARGGRNRPLRGAVEVALAQAGITAQVLVTTGPADTERLAARLGAEGALVIVAGGDGTIHDAVNGIVGTPGTLAVLPMGTGNDYAGALGTPRGLAEAARALVEAPVLALDVGRVMWTDGDGRSHERAFANCLGVGFDAYAAARAAETKWLGGRAAYLAAVLRTLWDWRRPDVHVHIEGSGVDYDGPLFLCEVGNGHSVGGGFLITPDARLDDGALDICVVRHLPPRRALRLLPQTFTGAHVTAPEVTMARGLSLSLTVTASGAGGVGIQADGEGLTADAREVWVWVEPGALAVLAPQLHGVEPAAGVRYDSYPSARVSLSPHVRRT